MKILHISDTHFHHEDKTNESLLKRIGALKSYLDHIIIITGDVTDDGRDDQRKKALEGLKSLTVVVLPGNHDYGAIGNIYDEKDAKAFDNFAHCFSFNEGPFFNKNPVVIKIENILFILLNSCLKTENPFDLACGSIGRKQLGLLGKILDDPNNKNLVKIVVLHHHPFIHSDPTTQLLDADRLMRTIYRKADVLLFGHKHIEGQWENKGGCKFILAAGALFDSNGCKEIIIEKNNITVNPILFYI